MGGTFLDLDGLTVIVKLQRWCCVPVVLQLCYCSVRDVMFRADYSNWWLKVYAVSSVEMLRVM